MATALVRQVPTDFASIETEVVLNGNQDNVSLGLVSGLDEFDYSAKANRTEMYGSGRLPMAEPTEGDAEFEGSITVLRFWFDWLVEQAREAGVGLFDLTLTIAFSYYGTDPATGDKVLHVDTLKGVKLNEIGNSGSRGSDPNMVSMPLRIGNIYYDGVDVYGNTL
jgi:hypothetical protein